MRVQPRIFGVVNLESAVWGNECGLNWTKVSSYDASRGILLGWFTISGFVSQQGKSYQIRLPICRFLLQYREHCVYLLLSSQEVLDAASHAGSVRKDGVGGLRRVSLSSCADVHGGIPNLSCSAWSYRFQYKSPQYLGGTNLIIWQEVL